MGVPSPATSSARLLLASLRPAVQGRSVVPAAQRRIEVPPALAELLPDAGLRRGSTVAVCPGPVPGAAALVLALLSTATTAGTWCAVVGVPSLGLVGARQLGVDLAHLVLVPRPGAQWATVTAALMEGIEVVVVRAPTRVRPADARRLGARARERGRVLVPFGDWPEPPDVRMTVTGATWEGLGSGHGHLRARRLELEVSGRRGAARGRRAQLWLPGPDGGLQAARADARAPSERGRQGEHLPDVSRLGRRRGEALEVAG